MEKLFEVKVRYAKAGDKGLVTKVREAYIVEAADVSAAQKRITEELTPFVTDDELTVTSAKEVEYADVDDKSGDFFYKTKASAIMLDEKSGREKVTKFTSLISASSVNDVAMIFDERMRNVGLEARIVSVQETAILEVYRIDA